MIYQRTQRSTWIVWIFLPIAAVIVGTALFAPDLPVAVQVMLIGILGFFYLVIRIFSRLTVTVESERVVVAFGGGWPRRVVAREEIRSVRPVRNSWLYGWGIRWIPRGSLWNVAGFDAVELELVSGRRLRIGSDDPEGLATALRG